MTAARNEDYVPHLRDFVAEEVRVALTRRRMSGAELARRMNRSQTFVAKRLDGRQAFDLDDLEVVSAILDVPVWSFLPQPEPPRYDPGLGRAIPRLLPDSAGAIADDAQAGSLIRFPVERRRCDSTNDTAAIRQQC